MQQVQEADIPTAGTIFHATKLPLTLWFAAIHLIVLVGGTRLGVKQPTAWAVKHKIMAVMARREGETRLTGRVEMDDAYLGGVRSGGKRGRGAAGKTPFVAAVSTSPEGRPRKLKLVPVKGFREREIARGAKHWLPRRGGCDGRLGLLERTRRDRLQPSGNPHRVGPTGGPHGAVQMGEHDAATSSARSPGPIASSAPITPGASPVSPGATTGVINSKPFPRRP